MKSVIADLFTRAHVENRLARRLKSTVVKVVVGGSFGLPFSRIRIDRSQVRGKFLPHRLGRWRSIVLEPWCTNAARRGGQQRGGEDQADKDFESTHVTTLAAILADDTAAQIDVLTCLKMPRGRPSVASSRSRSTRCTTRQSERSKKIASLRGWRRRESDVRDPPAVG